MPRAPRDTYKAHQHWVYEAHQQKEARALGDKLGLSFPNGSAGGPESDFMYPIRRLVVTGQDTPSNMRLLFGTSSISNMTPYHEARRLVLIDELSGVSSSAAGNLDQGCPYWSPRPASREETEEIEKLLRFERKYKDILPCALGGSKHQHGRKISVESDEGYGRGESASPRRRYS
ncbi:hypothetical protein INS49_003161 [Diaporthe citri]|uniref:uncharacterized protein n=1 Tax=Diaporthe citri TaxID=83186 RepID=UPI001C8146FA|nr:uncharacterized protein INS49_003161 [Diaporthe citri]KAG6368943.1 hypothetical protein INS49_003161 [Diaporthe citri]